MLKRSAATTMGAIHFSAEGTIKSCYRTNELISAVEHLMESEWDIEKALPEAIPAKHLLYNPATLLKSLYTSVKKAMAAEITQVDEVLKKVEGYVGDINKDNLISTLSAIQDLFSVFAQNGILGANDLRTKYEKAPVEVATEILEHTDGQENASHNYTSDHVKKMIRRQEERYGWEFLFVAANIDAVETASSIGIRRERAANYNYSKKGTRNLYVAVDSVVTSMRNCEEPNESWKDELNKD